MTAPTHVVFSNVLYLSVMTLAGSKVSPVELSLCSIGSLLPDIDTTRSFIGRVLFPISSIIEKKIGHRGVTHSLLFSSIFFFALLPFSFRFAFALWMGYVGHLLADMLTISGVPLLYPASYICVMPGNDDYRIRTGTWKEFVLLGVMASLFLPALRLNAVSIERTLHKTFKNMSSAVADYNELAGNNRVFLYIEGYFQHTQGKVLGEYEVVARLDENTLLVQDMEGNLYSVGRKSENQIYPVKAYVSRYEPVRWRSTVVDLTGYTKSDILKLPGRLVGTGELLDPYTEKDPLVFYNTIRGTKNVQILWAKPEDFPDGIVFLHGKVAVRSTEPFEPEKFSLVRVYETGGGIPLVVQGDYVKRGEVIISKRRQREIVKMKIEKIEKEMKFTYPDLKTVDAEKYSEDKRELSRQLEELYNELLSLDDVTAIGDGEVVLVDEKRVVIREYQR